MIRPVVLVILDGWGVAPSSPTNAISQAATPAITRLTNSYPHTLLAASGEAVGLPHGEDGNTETGHLNIGAGQIVYQDLPRINMSIADGSFFENPAFKNAISHLNNTHGKLHLIGLIGSGGVHSNIEHLFALMRLAKQNHLQEVYLHLITDGRDSPPSSALTYIAQVKQQINSLGIGAIATVMGRYWAMDRDHRWERTAKAYFALTKGDGQKAASPEEAVKSSYEQQKTDEFIEPTIMVSTEGKPVALVGDGDAVFFYNFRIDRPRQLAKAFVLPNFEKMAREEGYDPFAVKYYRKHIVSRRSETTPFTRGQQISNLYFVTMTRYEENLPADVAFPPQFIIMPLGRVLSDKGFRQLRVAETEKERFVTYFFNGQRSDPFPGEDRTIVPSPAVSTYDLKPEMSTPEMTDLVCRKLREGTYDFIVVNVACPDMVAHTGNLEATEKACEAADRFVDTVSKEVLGRDGALILTGDHGNAEELFNSATGEPDTEHSTYPVPLVVATNSFRNSSPRHLQSGILADIAPTVLKLLGIEKPMTMTGRSLL